MDAPTLLLLTPESKNVKITYLAGFLTYPIFETSFPISVECWKL